MQAHTRLCGRSLNKQNLLEVHISIVCNKKHAPEGAKALLGCPHE